ncbi:hypothetical protein [Streptomyces sp. NPDC055189]
MAEPVDEPERRAPDGAHGSLIADGGARFLYGKSGSGRTAPVPAGVDRTV